MFVIDKHKTLRHKTIKKMKEQPTKQEKYICKVYTRQTTFM